MAKEKNNGKNKAEWLAEEVAKAVDAGKPFACETVDFSDINRPPTCIEVDFPIIPINQIATIEGSSGATRKPVYQVTKWWARRNSSVFRAILLAAAIKAPNDSAEAAKKVWQSYYGNHQKKGAFSQIKVADIFMGGGTTVVEGSRLGMQMFGNDLNPVAWFAVKNELVQANKAEVESALAGLEAEVKPQIMPFYTCDCPRGHKAKWTQISTGKVMGSSFDPFTLTPEQRKDYRYEGAEVIYVFWSKHGPCQVTGCGHRTPIMSSPVMAVKELSVKFWPRVCKHCDGAYDIEERDARIAPSADFVIAETEKPFAVGTLREGKNGLEPESAICPCCGKTELFQILGKGAKKKVEFSLLLHPNWLRGEPNKDSQGRLYGGSTEDDVESTIRWNQARAKTCRLVEVRGSLPEVIKCPGTGLEIKTGKDGGTVPKKSSFSCGSCGSVQDVLQAIKPTKKTGPVAMYAIQGYCPTCDSENQVYSGRFFMPLTDPAQFNGAILEWSHRKENDLSPFWPRSEVPYGFMTASNNGDIRLGHGFTHWWKMFNPRQLLVHSVLLKAISSNPSFEIYLLGAFQQYLRNQSMFTIWNLQADQLEPQFANNNYHPKSNMIENGVFHRLGRGNWQSCSSSLVELAEWHANPNELVSNARLGSQFPSLADSLSGKSERVCCTDPVNPEKITLECTSSTELSQLESGSFDLVITDPPFGGLLHYSELADFFYAWLRLNLKTRYPKEFGPDFTPKTLEAVANRARQPGKDEVSGKDNADVFYQRILTACYAEAKRILKPGGILAFTFHHSEDAPWVSVLESLFDAGFYLQATYPIRSDETKGEGSKPGTFGSQQIEFDIIHVCRKRFEAPTPISWAKLRRQVIQDIRSLKDYGVKFRLDEDFLG